MALMALAALLILPGCGGGAPLLHPAHTLGAGKVTAGAGVSGNFVLGDALSAGSSDPRQAEAESAVVDASVAPGVAPWVGSRVGLGLSTEAGLLYSGRALRVDGRHAFESAHAAFSIGLGASMVLARQRETPPSGWGVDLPIMVGWRSDASLVQAWAGVRAGFEAIDGKLNVEPVAPTDPSEFPFDAQRYWGAGLVGLAVGVEPIRVAVELDAAYFDISGSTEALEGRFGRSGWALTPGGALIGHF
jgi:hypothetical protein